MSSEQDLTEEFVATTLQKYLLAYPQEAITLAIEYYRKNSQLRRACHDLCESSNKMNAAYKDLRAEQEILLAKYRKTTSALKQSRLCFLILLGTFCITIFNHLR